MGYLWLPEKNKPLFSWVPMGPSDRLVFSFPLPWLFTAMACPCHLASLAHLVGNADLDLLKGVLVFAVHSVRPSDIKFVAALGYVEPVSIS